MSSVEQSDPPWKLHKLIGTRRQNLEVHSRDRLGPTLFCLRDRLGPTDRGHTQATRRSPTARFPGRGGVPASFGVLQIPVGTEVLESADPETGFREA
ncbi:MAG: hypothetical protein RIS24_3276 [Verrucomicrobiota bacterium]|jgi:hypothetical protein